MKVKKDETNNAFPIDTLFHDFKTGETSKVSFINEDLPLVKWSNDMFVFSPQKNVTASFLEITVIKTAEEEKQLKGELEKLAATLDIEDNPIVVIVKFK